jgi:tetratricopeptide (TPR) repeat protein
MTAAPILLLLWMQVQAPASDVCMGDGAVDCWLAKGLASAFRAETEMDGVKKKALLEDAASDFGQALALDPSRGAALNNLAQVDADLGRDADAQRFFERAVALSAPNAPLRPFYRRNFGDFLAARGQWDRAIDEYRGTLEEQLSDVQAHESLMAVLAQRRPEAIPDYLRFLLDRSQWVRAEEAALSRLQAAPTEEYLSLLAEARAGQTTPPDQLLPQPVADVLAGLTGDRVGEGARELLALREGGDFDPASFSWWAERPGPRQAFRSLARSFGDTQRQAGRVASAGDYYRLAVLLTEEEPDLVSFRRMLELPSAIEDVQTLDRLATWNERSLRKHGARSRTDLYQYRHDLGLHYASLKKWEDCGCPTSGIYQLERAIPSAPSTDITKCPEGDPPFDPRIYFELARGYLATGRDSEAIQVLSEVGGAMAAHCEESAGQILSAPIPGGPGRTEPTSARPEETIFEPILRDFRTEPPRPPIP